MTTIANTENTKRLVLVVPDDFHHRLKVTAAEDRKDMRDVVIECVTACLEARLASGSPAKRLAQPRTEG